MNYFIETMVKGAYILFCRDEDAVHQLGYNNFTTLNLPHKESLKVIPYFDTHKLKIIESGIMSYSDSPNQTLACIIDLLQKNSKLLVGTAGLSNESIHSIIAETRMRIRADQTVVFVYPMANRKVQLVPVDDLFQLPNF